MEDFGILRWESLYLLGNGFLEKSGFDLFTYDVIFWIRHSLHVVIIFNFISLTTIYKYK